MLIDAEPELSSLCLYTCDDGMFWGVGSEELTFRVWHRIIAVNDGDLSNFGTLDIKRTRNFASVAEGLQTFSV